MDFEPRCMAIAIGSLPHKSIDEAIELVLKYLPEAPIWPQLPKSGLFESMMVQYTEGMPCIKFDGDTNKVFFDLTDESYLDEISERFALALDDKYEEFRISEKFAKGFYALTKRLSDDLPETVQIIKGHVTGPISFGLSMHDENGRSVLYNDDLKDVYVRILAMKAKWQEAEFRKISKDITPMIFFDEPSLTQIGTPFVSISRDEAVELLNACLDEVSGIKGIHVCGNTDWSLVTETHTDVVNFDAYAHPESLSLYPEEVSDFLDRGGMIAWGITPSTEEIKSEDEDSILIRFEKAVELLCRGGIDKDFVLRRSFISPSCGTGSLTDELAERVFMINFKVSNLIRKKYF